MSEEMTTYIDEGPVNWATLSRLRLLDNVGRESVEGLLRTCPIRQLQPGEILISAGQPNNAMYLLLSGRLRVHLDAIDGEPVAVLEAGESVGELSVMDRQPASAFVVADQYSQVLLVAKDIVWRLVEVSHGLARNLLFRLAERLRNSNSTTSESKRLQQAYKRQTTVDDLTGLHNRCWLEKMLERLTKRSFLGGRPMSLIMADVDHFKEYKDEFGDAAGDHALYAVAQTLVNAVRPTDLLARYGGGKFAIVLPDTDIVGAKIVAARLRARVAEAVIVMSDQSILPSVTVSLGAVQMTPHQSGEKLVAEADAALTRAKAHGRNCMVE